MHWLRDVLDRLFTKIFKGERQLVPDVFVNGAGDTDAARFRQTLQPRRDVDAVAVELLPIHNHIAKIDSDAKLHPPRRRDALVFRLESDLNVDCALDCIHHAGEFRQDAITSRADESAVMLFDQAVDDLPMRGQSAEGRLFIFPHEPAVAVDIGTQDCGKLAFHARVTSALRRACQSPTVGASAYSYIWLTKR
jgi:hypothetical protein